MSSLAVIFERSQSTEPDTWSGITSGFPSDIDVSGKRRIHSKFTAYPHSLHPHRHQRLVPQSLHNHYQRPRLVPELCPQIGATLHWEHQLESCMVRS